MTGEAFPPPPPGRVLKTCCEAEQELLWDLQRAEKPMRKGKDMALS